jgi:hypothetical protein
MIRIAEVGDGSLETVPEHRCDQEKRCSDRGAKARSAEDLFPFHENEERADEGNQQNVGGVVIVE